MADDPPSPTPGAELEPRARILRATVELIAEVGWTRVTTRSVAERASVNNALVHYYFGSKRALLQQAATEALMAEFGGPMEALAAGDDLARGVRELIASFGTVSSPSGRLVVEITQQALRDPDLQDLVRDLLREFRRAVEARLRTAGRPAQEARGLAVVLAALLDGLYLHVLLDPDIDLSAAAEALRPLLPEEDR